MEIGERPRDIETSDSVREGRMSNGARDKADVDLFSQYFELIWVKRFSDLVVLLSRPGEVVNVMSACKGVSL